MSYAPLPTPPVIKQLQVLSLAAVLLVVAWLALTPTTGVAHAELIRSDPPADGLALTSPDQLSMTFTEEVVRDRPAPNITLLDESGAVVGSAPLAIAPSDDPRTLIVPIPGLDRGTYTVSWEVTSATDGHTLSGAYAFRVGGGLPPGVTTTSDATPAPWAVATRWLTFLGVAMVAGLFLFSDMLIVGNDRGTSWARQRTRFILTGSLLALVATAAEPVVQWLRADNAAGLSFGDTLESLPEAWWWRPALLIPLTGLALVTAFSWRGRVPRAAAWL
ncbi:MAG: copper resistance protein CopC, partial [Chloroflexota bacterium]|nr:copper resistance protein CopC [Chloroflexota bacterium]